MATENERAPWDTTIGWARTHGIQKLSLFDFAPLLPTFFNARFHKTGIFQKAFGIENFPYYLLFGIKISSTVFTVWHLNFLDTVNKTSNLAFLVPGFSRWTSVNNLATLQVCTPHPPTVAAVAVEPVDLDVPPPLRDLPGGLQLERAPQAPHRRTVLGAAAVPVVLGGGGGRGKLSATTSQPILVPLEVISVMGCQNLGLPRLL